MDGSASHSLTHSLSTHTHSLSLPPPSKMEEPLLLYSMPRKSNTTTINTPSATDSIYLSLSLSLGLEGGGRTGEEKVIAPPPLPMRRRCRYCRLRRRRQWPQWWDARKRRHRAACGKNVPAAPRRWNTRSVAVVVVEGFRRRKGRRPNEQKNGVNRGMERERSFSEHNLTDDAQEPRRRRRRIY